MHPAHPLMRAGRQQRVAAAAEPRPQQADAPPRMDVDPAALLARDWMDVKALYKNMVSKEAKKAAETRLAAERKAAAAAAQAKQQAAALARQQAASKAAKEAQRQKSAAGRNGAGPAAAAKAGASSDRKPSQTGSSKPSPEPSTSGSGSSSSPAAAAVPGFKGFGAAPPAAVAAAEAAANPRALKVFRHAVDLDRVQGAISGNSWQVRRVDGWTGRRPGVCLCVWGGGGVPPEPKCRPLTPASAAATPCACLACSCDGLGCLQGQACCQAGAEERAATPAGCNARVRPPCLQNRVLVVDDIRQADAVIAVKLTRGGAHINHDQVGAGHHLPGAGRAVGQGGCGLPAAGGVASSCWRGAAWPLQQLASCWLPWPRARNTKRMLCPAG